MIEFRMAELANGLKVIGEINQQAYSMALGAFVQTGARDESDETSGCSHFLEHMIFKGTETRSAEDVNRQLDEMGGRSNAFTSDESTVFYCSVLPQTRTMAIDLILDLLHPAIRQTDFDTEKNVILEEISMYEDQPPYGIDDKTKEIFFQGHPLGRSVLGTKEIIGNLQREQMLEYHAQHYSPERILIAVAGKVDFDVFCEEIQQRTRHWASFPVARESFRPTGAVGTHLFTRAACAQEYVFQTISAPSAKDLDRNTAVLTANILGDDVGSRIFWALVDSGKADIAGLSYCDYTDAGLFGTCLCCAPEDVSDNMKIMNDLFLEAIQNGVYDEELVRAKNKILARIVLGSERPMGRMFALGSEWLQTGKYHTMQEEMELVKNVSLDDISSILQKYRLDNPLITAIGPLTQL